MSRERRIELVDKLVDQGLTPEEQEELDRLQREPWEPPIDVKNEIRMAEWDNRLFEDAKNAVARLGTVQDAWVLDGCVATWEDIEKLRLGADPRTIGPEGCARMRQFSADDEIQVAASSGHAIHGTGPLGRSAVKPSGTLSESFRREFEGR